MRKCVACVVRCCGLGVGKHLNPPFTTQLIQNFFLEVLARFAEKVP